MIENRIISFSGGRTSGYMLYRELAKNSGRLPENTRVLFCNTGKEKIETLDFINECAKRWNVEITWLEFQAHEETQKRWRVVDYETASRNGEPFADLIYLQKYLPNVMTRICTVGLKIKPMKFYCQQVLGWENWTNVIGIRYDEPRRYQRAKIQKDVWQVDMPLYEDGITEEHVFDFWNHQSFDLGIRGEQGNCDLCFLKGTSKNIKLIRENPRLADWWIKQEQKCGATFSKTVSYEGMKRVAVSAIEIPFVQDAHAMCDVTCTD